MFSSAFPFAALCAWANNILEIRTDFLKLTVASQRPFPAPAIGIGSWLLAFEFLSAAAVVTNVALIGDPPGPRSVVFATPFHVNTIRGDG